MSLFSTIFRYRDKKSPDRLGLYPEKFHLPSFPERRYLWTSRILVIFAVLSFCITIMLTMVVYLLLPQKDAIPIFYRSNLQSFSLEKVQPQRIKVSYQDMLTEKYIEDYIEMRHAIPKSSADLYYKWDTSSLFYWYSGLNNYYKFIHKINKEQLRSFMRQQMKRFVDIKKITKISNDFWIAEFTTTTTTKNIPEPNTIRWKAYMRIRYLEFDKYEDLEKTEEEKKNYISNPFGFKVMQYSLSYVGKPEKADTAMEVAKKIFETTEDVVK